MVCYVERVQAVHENNTHWKISIVDNSTSRSWSWLTLLEVVSIPRFQVLDIPGGGTFVV
jgi:hypothetical protein